MNSCILMAEIVETPQLRYTTDNLAITEMFVQFPGLGAKDQPATLKVVGWGNLAQEIEQKYHKGDHIIIEGRLSMNTVPLEGYKEKRAELVAQRIHPLGANDSPSATPDPSEMSSQIKSDSPGRSRFESVEKPVAVGVAAPSETAEPVTQSKPPQPVAYPPLETDMDDIPF